MARPSQNFTQPVYHAPAFDAVAAVGVVTAAVAVFFLVGLFLAPGLGALAGAQLIGLGAVPIVVAVVQRRPLLALGVGRPDPLAMVGAAIFGATFWYVNLRVWGPLVELLDRGELPALQARILAAGDLPVQLLAVAVVPALCEELAMRGVLARSLAPIGHGFAIVVSAAAFAGFHLSAVRFGPTLTLGLALSAMAIRTGTIWPSAIAHGLNNAAALLIATGAIALPSAIDDHPAVALAVAVTLAGGGIALAVRRPSS
jgi:membrane protease YdiL (CAAX protease family)